MTTKRIVACADCGNERGHHGRGLCVSCYMRNRKAGTLLKFAPLPAAPRPPGGECGTYAGFATHRRHGEQACQPCKDASTRYAKGHRHDRLHARRRTVPAEPVVAHLRNLLRAGMTQGAIARGSGVSPSAISDLLHGQSRIKQENAKQILSVRSVYCFTPRHEHDEAFVPKTPSVLRIRALLALGWRHQDMAERSGVLTHLILAQPSPAVTVRNHDRVRALYEALSMTPGPSQRTRNRAARAGFLPPLALDDDRIEDPNYLPGLEVDDQLEQTVDQVVVERLVDGGDHRALNATRAERIAALQVIQARSRRYRDPDSGHAPAGIEPMKDASRRLGLQPTRDLPKEQAS